MWRRLLAVAASSLVFALGACGSESSTTIGHGFGTGGSGAAQFEVEGADNSIQQSGSEGSKSELAEAANALHGYLDARATGAWAAACDYLAAGVVAQLSSIQDGNEAASCLELIADLFAGVPLGVLREAAVADAGSLRVEGDSGFLLFHGARDLKYFMPMARERGTWRVAGLTPSAL